MAFYFALLNVSSRKEEKQPKARRRRHSIASVESPLLDYRLLPRPRVVSKELIRDENEDSDEPGPSVRRRSRNRENRAMKKSESSYCTYKKADHNSNREPSSERKNANKEPVDTDEFGEHKKSEKQARKDERLSMNQIWTPEMIITLKNDLTPTDKPSCLLTSTPKSSKNLPQAMRSISPRLSELRDDQITKLESKNDRRRRKEEIRSKSSDKEQKRRLFLRNHTSQADVHVNEVPNALRSTKRGKGGRPLIAKRRLSTTESTTSGSRRSSKESQRSLPRKESPVSSISSTKESDNKHVVVSPSHTNPVASTYLSKYTNDKVPQLKKVTFETVNSPYVINRSFLGERAVLVRRLSGCETVLRNSASDPNEKIAMPHSGEEWLKRLEHTDDLQNSIGSMANICIMDRPVKSCLLRRRSTSDRRHLTVSYRKNDSSKDLMTLSVDRPHNL